MSAGQEILNLSQNPVPKAIFLFSLRWSTVNFYARNFSSKLQGNCKERGKKELKSMAQPQGMISTEREPTTFSSISVGTAFAYGQIPFLYNLGPS